ncbi:MAG: hypothetical protein ACRD4H_01930 [Candidatus Acidiferrales bacterium]
MNSETKVFIAGSRRLSKLSKDVRGRIDKIIEKRLTIIIGDANGVDKTVQKYLSAKHYSNVIVFCMEGDCRNNLGSWSMRTITASQPQRKDFAYFATKDRAMAEEADYGLMLWDGQSRGTLTSIVDLVLKEKLVVVYVSTDKNFYTLRQTNDLATMLRHVDPVALRRIDRDLQLPEMIGASSRKVDSMSLLF